MTRLCECGCGKEVKWCKQRKRQNRFIFGHQCIGTKNTNETIKKMKKAQKGHQVSEETRKKIGDAQRGEKNHRYGKKNTIEHNKKISEGNIGKKQSKSTKEKISDALKGEKHHMYGKKHTKKTRNKQSKSHMGHIVTEKTKEKISDALKGEKNPMYGKTGEKHPMWNNGSSFEPYGLDFNKEFRKKIRERDDYFCQMCNKHETESKRRLTVHHIDYIKTNTFPQNCVSLCLSCHIRTNTNRDSWKIFFQDLLKRKYGYEYTEDQKIILDFIRGN